MLHSPPSLGLRCYTELDNSSYFPVQKWSQTGARNATWEV